MKTESTTEIIDQQYLAVRIQPIERLSIYPQMIAFLKSAGIIRVEQLLDMTHRDLCSRLGVKDDVAVYIFEQIDTALSRQNHPFVCLTLPTPCFEKPLDVLKLPVNLQQVLEYQINSLSKLASLEMGDNRPGVKTIVQAFLAYVQQYRQEQRQPNDAPIVNVTYTTSPRVSLTPQLMENIHQTSPTSSLDVLELPPHLLSYLSKMGIDSLEQITDLSHDQMKIVLGLDDDAVDFLYAAIRQHAKLKNSPSYTIHKSSLKSQASPKTFQIKLPVFHKPPSAPLPPDSIVMAESLPVITEERIVQILVECELLEEATYQMLNDFDSLAHLVLKIWDTPLSEITYFSSQNIQQTGIQTFGQLLEIIMAQNIKWLKESAFQQGSTPPSLSLTPLLIYIKQMHDNQRNFLQDSLKNRFLQWFLQLYNRILSALK